MVHWWSLLQFDPSGSVSDLQSEQSVVFLCVCVCVSSAVTLCETSVDASHAFLCVCLCVSKSFLISFCAFI